jgi:hypothetical protein
MTRSALLLLAVAARVGHAGAPISPPIDATPEGRAKSVLAAQIAALQAGDDSIIKTFSGDAVVLVPGPREAKTPDRGLREAIARLSPHFSLKKIAIVKLVAGGNVDAVWFSGELAITAHGAEPGEKQHDTKTTLRVTELVTAQAGWIAVAAAFSEPGKPLTSMYPPGAVPNPTEAGPLAALLAAPVQLDAALGSDASVTVFGTDAAERGYGAKAAHALVGTWSKLVLAIDGKPREVRDKQWGYAITQLKWNKPKDQYPSWMSGLVIAVPAAGGKWSVVAVQYTSAD